VLGVFKPSDFGLYFDYAKMIASDGAAFMCDLDNRTYDQLKLFKDLNAFFSETNIKEITKLDYSQKKACHIAINDSLVIEGPPGTGKSQTISNISANLIDQRKSVLFVTEKKTAAEVVYNRLGRLRNYCLKFFETKNATKEFTRQIKNGLQRIGILYGNISKLTNARDTGVASDDLDELFKRVDDYKIVMTDRVGHKYPEFLTKYNLAKEKIQNANKMVGSLIAHSDNSHSF
jgi:reverse gyrase